MLKIALTFVLISTASLAYAQKEPFEITSEALEISQQKATAVFEQDVNAHYMDATLNAQKVVVYYKNDGDTLATNSAVQKAIATGNVSIIKGKDKATGDKATFDINRDDLVMEGNVTLTRNGTVLKGEKLTYNLKTGDVNVKAENTGRIKAQFGGKQD